jgi:hypothetical protein
MKTKPKPKPRPAGKPLVGDLRFTITKDSGPYANNGHLLMIRFSPSIIEAWGVKDRDLAELEFAEGRLCCLRKVSQPSKFSRFIRIPHGMCGGVQLKVVPSLAERWTDQLHPIAAMEVVEIKGDRLIFLSPEWQEVEV